MELRTVCLLVTLGDWESDRTPKKTLHDNAILAAVGELHLGGRGNAWHVRVAVLATYWN
jgi:hypothetical protein